MRVTNIAMERLADPMSKPTSAVKRRYNKAAYRRYEFSIKLDSKLNYKLERYKADGESGLSELIRNLLCEHFGVDADEIYMPYHLRTVNGQWIQVPNEL